MKRCAIIGGGISGLCTAYFLQKKSREMQIDLYEAQPQPGGVLRSETIDDCVLDAGPDSFLTQKKAGVDLCRELGLESQLVPSNDAGRKTFLYHDGKLKPLPEGFFLMVPTKLAPFVTTDLLTWPGKFAALADLFMLPETRDVSVAEFLERRFGREILDQIAEPLLSGVYGADVRRLSLKSALPQIWELQRKGSLIRSLVGAGHKGGSAPQSLFTTLKGGMQMIAKALQQKCDSVQWKLGTKVESIEKKNGLWRIGSEDYDILISASSLPPVSDSAGKIREKVLSIRRNSAIVTVLYFEQLHREGFGWLVPSSQRRSILACTYVNNKFPGRAPSKGFLVRAFIGGRNADEWMDRSDDEIQLEVQSELNRIAQISERPRFCRIYRWPQAMPEYEVGHEKKIAEIKEMLKAEGNLYLSGNIFSGVGLPDCIQYAERVAGEVLNHAV